MLARVIDDTSCYNLDNGNMLRKTNIRKKEKVEKVTEFAAKMK